MLALATVQATVFDVPHLFRVATPQHLGHQAIIIRRLVTRMGVLKRLPVIRKDLLEDTPVPRGCCNHRMDDLYSLKNSEEQYTFPMHWLRVLLSGFTS